jgi:hypothetical protein
MTGTRTSVLRDGGKIDVTANARGAAFLDQASQIASSAQQARWSTSTVSG